MTEPTITLTDQLRDLKYHQRLDQASLISGCTDKDERVATATAIVRELAMHRVFDQMTRAQDIEILNLFSSLAELESASPLAPFGIGAVSYLHER